MKKLVTLFAIAVMAASLSVAASAQPTGPAGGKLRGQAGPGGPGGMMGRMAGAEKEILAKLNLTPAQQKKVDALDKSTKEKFEALMKAPGERSTKMEKFKEIGKARRDGLNKILTPAQLAKYQALLKEMRSKRQKARGTGDKPNPPRGKAKP